MKERTSLLTSFALGVIVIGMGIPIIHEGSSGIAVIIMGLLILGVTAFFFFRIKR